MPSKYESADTKKKKAKVSSLEGGKIWENIVRLRELADPMSRVTSNVWSVCRKEEIGMNTKKRGGGAKTASPYQ